MSLLERLIDSEYVDLRGHFQKPSVGPQKATFTKELHEREKPISVNIQEVSEFFFRTEEAVSDKETFLVLPYSPIVMEFYSDAGGRMGIVASETAESLEGNSRLHFKFFLLHQDSSKGIFRHLPDVFVPLKHGCPEKVEGSRLGFETGLVKDEDPETFNAILELTHLGLYAISLFHYNGVQLVEARQTRQKQRSRERKKKPLIRHHTLVLKPLQDTLRHMRREDAEVQKTGKLPVHSVRGHRAVYTPEKPLFGRIVGPVFRKPHLRGSAKIGLITKDYKISMKKREER